MLFTPRPLVPAASAQYPRGATSFQREFARDVRPMLCKYCTLVFVSRERNTSVLDEYARRGGSYTSIHFHHQQLANGCTVHQSFVLCAPHTRPTSISTVAILTQ